MPKWSFHRPSKKRLPRALHTPAFASEQTCRDGEFINEINASDKQAWADCEEAMAGLYLNLLTLKEVAGNEPSGKLNGCVSRVFDTYSAVLASFAVYLETCSGTG